MNAATGIALALGGVVVVGGGYVAYRAVQAKSQGSSTCAEVQKLGRLFNYDIPPSWCEAADGLGGLLGGLGGIGSTIKSWFTPDPKKPPPAPQDIASIAPKCKPGESLVVDKTKIVWSAERGRYEGRDGKPTAEQQNTYNRLKQAGYSSAQAHDAVYVRGVLAGSCKKVDLAPPPPVIHGDGSSRPTGTSVSDDPSSPRGK